MNKIIRFIGVVGILTTAATSVCADSQKATPRPAPLLDSPVTTQGLTTHFIDSFLSMSEDNDQEGMNKIFESMALLISEELGNRGYTQEQVDSLNKEEIDEVIRIVFSDAHTWSIEDLHEAASAPRAVAMQFAEDEAVNKYPYLAEQKAKNDAFLEMEGSTSFTDVSRGFYKDSFGYNQGYLQLSFENNSAATVSHIEMDVIAFDGQPGKGVLFMKGDTPVEPGQVAILKADIDPSSLLGPRFLKADPADIGYKLKSYYTVNGGRINEVEFTDDMQDTFEMAEKKMATQK